MERSNKNGEKGHRRYSSRNVTSFTPPPIFLLQLALEEIFNLYLASRLLFALTGHFYGYHDPPFSLNRRPLLFSLHSDFLYCYQFSVIELRNLFGAEGQSGILVTSQTKLLTSWNIYLTLNAMVEMTPLQSSLFIFSSLAIFG